MNIFWQHTNNWFTRATQTERQTIDNHQKPLVMTLSDMDWSPTTLDVVVWARSSSLQFLTVKNVYSGIIAFLIFLRLMSKLASSAVKEYHILIWKSILHFQRRWQNKGDIWQRHGEHYTDACIMEIDSWEDHTSWCGNFKFEPVISQIIHRPRQRYWGGLWLLTT